ncbi:MAG: type III pantothenate kinase [bacterium]
MLLAIDIGNSHIVCGVFQNKNLLKTWRISTDAKKTEDEYGIIIVNLLEKAGIIKEHIDGVIISSVVPLLNETLERVSKEYFKIEPFFIGHNIKIDMPILYDNPSEVGADRIINAVAAYNKYTSPLIIIDLGTATTFCVVSAKGEYLGGCIAQGLAISAEVLYRKTAKLPQIRITRPDAVIGKNTVSSMQSGLFYGYVSLIEGLIQRIKQEICEKTADVKVILTGGLAELLASDLKDVILDRNLTLEGLRMIFENNTQTYVH